MELTFEQLPGAVAKILESLERIEKQLNQEHNPPTDNGPFMNIQEVAEFLNLSVPTIYGYVHKQAFPHYKAGKRLNFKKSELIEWILSSRRKSLTEIETEAESYITRTRNKNKW
jgi:excisionase family DNA binding protein